MGRRLTHAKFEVRLGAPEAATLGSVGGAGVALTTGVACASLLTRTISSVLLMLAWSQKSVGLPMMCMKRNHACMTVSVLIWPIMVCMS